MRRLLCGLLILTLESVALASIEILDPEQRLAQLGAELSAAPWETVSTCNSKQRFYRLDVRCEIKCGAFCLTQCEQAEGPDRAVDLVVEDCDGESVGVYGSNNLGLTLARTDYLQGGSFIAPLIRGFNHFVSPLQSAYISGLQSIPIKVVREGKVTSVFAKKLSVDFYYLPNTNPYTVDFIFFPGQDLLQGFAGVWSDSYTGQYFLKQAGVIGER